MFDVNYACLCHVAVRRCFRDSGFDLPLYTYICNSIYCSCLDVRVQVILSL